MTEIVVDRIVNLLEDHNRWGFFTRDGTEASVQPYDPVTQLIQFVNATTIGGVECKGLDGFSANIFGVDLKYNLSESGKIKFTSGTVTDVEIDFVTGSLRMAEMKVAAKTVDSLMRANTPESTKKLYAAICAGDDDVTLSLGSDKFSTYGGDDTVRGRAGDDQINAGAGDDILYGGFGRDTLTGGIGADIFVFDTKASTANADVVTDFNVAVDKLSLDHHVFRALKINADPDDGWFLANTTGRAKDAGDHLIYNTKTGQLFYDADGTGKAAAAVVAELSKGLKLTADHFDIF